MVKQKLIREFSTLDNVGVIETYDNKINVSKYLYEAIIYNNIIDSFIFRVTISLYDIDSTPKIENKILISYDFGDDIELLSTQDIQEYILDILKEKEEIIGQEIIQKITTSLMSQIFNFIEEVNSILKSNNIKQLVIN